MASTIVYDTTSETSDELLPGQAGTTYGFSFTVPIGGQQLQSFLVGLYNVGGSTGNITFELFSSVNNAPGSEIASLGTVNDAQLPQNQPQKVQINDNTGPGGLNLTAGTRYFIEAVQSATSNVELIGTDQTGGTGAANEYVNEGTTAASNNDVGFYTTATVTTVCFCDRTLIRTVRGDVAVEALRVGDLAVTSSGAHRPIRWLDSRQVQCPKHPRPHEVMPIRISAHAFGESRPARDLFVSPGHSICVDVLGEVLIPAGALVNGSTVQQVEVDEVTYWHIELDSHDVILAENLPSESYLDMGNRGFFREAEVVDFAARPDADPAQRTHADFCRPFVDGGPILDAVKAQLRRRAETLGWAHSDALELHLVVDGQRLDPVLRGLTARFAVPADAKDVWLEAPTARPCDVSESGDSRDLGLFIKALRFDDGFEARDIAIDDPLLCIGFHPVEEGSQRWTTGRARLPAALWEGCEDSFFLRVDLAGGPVPRWVAPAVRECPRLAIVA